MYLPSATMLYIICESVIKHNSSSVVWFGCHQGLVIRVCSVISVLSWRQVGGEHLEDTFNRQFYLLFVSVGILGSKLRNVMLIMSL